MTTAGEQSTTIGGAVQFPTISWADVPVTRNAGRGLAEWWQVSRHHVVQTLEHLTMTTCATLSHE